MSCEPLCLVLGSCATQLRKILDAPLKKTHSFLRHRRQQGFWSSPWSPLFWCTFKVKPRVFSSVTLFKRLTRKLHPSFTLMCERFYSHPCHYAQPLSARLLFSFFARLTRESSVLFYSNNFGLWTSFSRKLECVNIMISGQQWLADGWSCFLLWQFLPQYTVHMWLCATTCPSRDVVSSMCWCRRYFVVPSLRWTEFKCCICPLQLLNLTFKLQRFGLQDIWRQCALQGLNMFFL